MRVVPSRFPPVLSLDNTDNDSGKGGKRCNDGIYDTECTGQLGDGSCMRVLPLGSENETDGPRGKYEESNDKQCDCNVTVSQVLLLSGLRY